MVNIKKVKKKLAKLKKKKDKVKFLEKKFKDVNDKKLKENIKKILLSLKDDLEERVITEVPSVSIKIRDQDLDIPEEINQQLRGQTQVQEVNIHEHEKAEKEFNYAGDYKLSSFDYVLGIGEVSYESINSAQFGNIQFNQDNDVGGVNPLYQKFVEGGLLDQENPFTDGQRETIMSKLGSLSTSPEEALIKEQRLMLERKKINKKYITKFM